MPASRHPFFLSCISAGQVLADHQRHLKDDGMVKLAQIQTGKLLDLLQAVHQGVPVDEQLTGGFRNVQVVFKEFIDGKEGLLIQSVNGALFEHFCQVNVAKGGGQLIPFSLRIGGNLFVQGWKERKTGYKNGPYPFSFGLSILASVG